LAELANPGCDVQTQKPKQYIKNEIKLVDGLKKRQTYSHNDKIYDEFLNNKRPKTERDISNDHIE
jgi:hypothetical protein